MASGGKSGGIQSDSASGCDCRVGRGRGAGIGATLAIGALLAGQLRRLILRRESLARPEPPEPDRGEDPPR